MFSSGVEVIVGTGPSSLQVATMQKELEELQPKLVIAQEDNQKMMVVIERESAEVTARRKVVKTDEEAANKQAAEAKALKEEVGPPTV